MMYEIIVLLCSLVFLVMPLGFWMYVSDTALGGVSRGDFILGLFAGGIATIPLVLHESPYFSQLVYDIFLDASLLSGVFFDMDLFVSIVRFFAIVWTGCFCIGMILRRGNKRYFIRNLKTATGYSIVSLLVLGVFWGIFAIIGDTASSQTLQYGDIIFSSLASICIYYGIIGLLEEGTKTISSVSFGKEPVFYSQKRYLAFMMSIALGFAFFENILYMSSYISHGGIDAGLAQLVFMRSIFSVIVHILSSLIVGVGLWYIISKLSLEIHSVFGFILCSLGGIFAHSIFDIFMQFGYITAIFLYAFAMYILLGAMAHHQEQSPEMLEYV